MDFKHTIKAKSVLFIGKYLMQLEISDFLFLHFDLGVFLLILLEVWNYYLSACLGA